MPTQKSLRQSQLDLTRTRILDAAVQLMQSRNVTAISFGELAKEAGVSRRTVYRHFADHTALAGALLMHVSPFDRPPEYSSVEEMWALIPPYAQHFGDNPWIYRVLMGTKSRQSPQVAQLDAVHEDLVQNLSPEAAKAFLALMELIVSPHCFDVLMTVRGLSAEHTTATIRWAMKVLREAAGDPERLQAELDR